MPRASTKRSGSTGKWAHKIAAIEKFLHSKRFDARNRRLEELGEMFEDAGNQCLDIADEIRTAILKAKGKQSARKASKSRSGK